MPKRLSIVLRLLLFVFMKNWLRDHHSCPARRNLSRFITEIIMLLNHNINLFCRLALSRLKLPQDSNWSYYQFEWNLPWVYIVLLIARAENTSAAEISCSQRRFGSFAQKEIRRRDKSRKFFRLNLISRSIETKRVRWLMLWRRVVRCRIAEVHYDCVKSHFNLKHNNHFDSLVESSAGSAIAKFFKVHWTISSR